MKHQEKIGILTFHREINFGAYIQAYMLQKHLKSNGYDAVIIDYQSPESKKGNFNAFIRAKVRRPKELLQNALKISKFKKAQNKIKTTDHFSEPEQFPAAKLDAVVVGSDEVWNYNNQLYGADPLFFGVNIDVPKLVSYAPSFGFVNFGDPMPEKLESGLKSFTDVSVRDTNSKKIAEDILNKEVSLVVDPIFLSDIASEMIPPCPEKDFIAVYAGKIKKSHIPFIKEIAKKEGKKLISIGYNLSWCDKSIVSIDPFEWISYIKNASFVFTSMYHGILSSIKYNKNFCGIVTPKKMNKLDPIIDELRLRERIVTESKDLERVYREAIPYDEVNPILEQRIAESKEFLKNALQ